MLVSVIMHQVQLIDVGSELFVVFTVYSTLTVTTANFMARVSTKLTSAFTLDYIKNKGCTNGTKWTRWGSFALTALLMPNANKSLCCWLC